MAINLCGLSINEIEQKYRYGSLSYEEVRDYLRAWNAGPHFTQAVLCDGAIRNFDPESKSRPYSHLWNEFGVKA